MAVKGHIVNLLLMLCHLLLRTKASDLCIRNSSELMMASVEAAMVGYNPAVANPYERPDPGMKNQIFHPFHTDQQGVRKLNSFVKLVLPDGVQCDPTVNTHVISNFNQYNRKMFSDVVFDTASDEELFEDVLGSGQPENTIERFFTEGSGEIVLAEATCKVFTADILALPDAPVFTENFINDLTKLNEGARQNSSEAFVEFVLNYGTHYLKSVKFGSKVAFVRSFPRKSANRAQEASRSQCVRDAAMATIATGFCRSCSASPVFSRQTRNCDQLSTNSPQRLEDIAQVKLAAGGLPVVGDGGSGGDQLPSSSIKEWTEVSMSSAAPVGLRLSKISSLFTQSWFEELMSSKSVQINSTLLQAFVEKMSSNYCGTVFRDGRNCGPKTGCGYSDSCEIGTKCLPDELSDQGYKCREQLGASYVSGGWLHSNATPSVEVIAAPDDVMPDLPDTLWKHTITPVGHVLFLCGGLTRPSPNTNCYSLDTRSQERQWRKEVSLPVNAVYEHSAPAIGTHIWMMFYNKTIDYDTESGNVTVHQTPFYVERGYCAVSNSSHSIVMGVGDKLDEVWINTIENDPKLWHKIGTMSSRKFKMACLLFEEKIYMTGGESVEKQVEILDLRTNVVTVGGDLVTGRSAHQMFVLDNKPAVVGGYDGHTALASIETYHTENKTWTTSDQALKLGRFEFGLAQMRLA